MAETGFYRRVPDIPPWLPWAIIGLLVVLGGITSFTYGLPFASKADVIDLKAFEKTDRDSLITLQENQIVLTEQLKTTNALIERIQKRQDINEQNIQQNSIHIEGLESDEKARDSEDELRGRRR